MRTQQVTQMISIASACALLTSRDKIYDVFIEEDYVEAKVIYTKYAQIKDFEKELRNTPFLKGRPVKIDCVGKRNGLYFFRIS